MAKTKKNNDNLTGTPVFGKGTAKVIAEINKLYATEMNISAFQHFCDLLLEKGLTKEIYDEALKYAKPPIKNPADIRSYNINVNASNYELNFIGTNGKKLLTLVYDPIPTRRGIFKVIRATLYKQEV